MANTTPTEQRKDTDTDAIKEPTQTEQRKDIDPLFSKYVDTLRKKINSENNGYVTKEGPMKSNGKITDVLYTMRKKHSTSKHGNRNIRVP